MLAFGTPHFYGFIYRQGMRVEGVKKSVYGITFQKAAFFFILGSCRSEEFYSTTSEHSHVKMSAAGGLSQRQPRQIKHTRESEVIVTAGSAAK